MPSGAEAEPEKRPNTAKQVAVDEFGKMGEDEKKYLQDIATSVIAYCESIMVGHAYGYIEERQLTNDERLALWSLLPSNVRSALKKEAQLFKREKEPA